MLITTKNLTKKIIVKNDEDAHLYFEALALVKEEHRTVYMAMNSTVVTVQFLRFSEVTMMM